MSITLISERLVEYISITLQDFELPMALASVFLLMVEVIQNIVHFVSSS